MARKDDMLPGSALLPTVGEPGTFEWCEEVVECINTAWRTRETAEQAFLAAVTAALRYRIWETLSPPPPDDPYTSLDALIRHTAEPDQAEPMQIAIRFSGVLDEAATPGKTDSAARPAGEHRAPAETGAVAATGPASAQARAAAPGAAASNAAVPARPLSEEEEIALGHALLDRYDSPAAGPDAGAPNDPLAAAGVVGLPAGPGPDAAEAPAPVSPRRSAAERKRDRLERTHPELAEAVDAGEMTLKQAYIQAGIEKEARTLDKLQRLWRSASEDEREHFLSWIDMEGHEEQRQAYEKAVYGDAE